jgi:hypothetical protein
MSNILLFPNNTSEVIWMVEKITNDLESALLELNEQEKKYYELVAKLNEIDFKLFEKQCELINKGLITGRNREIRDAEMWRHTKELQKEKIS